MVQLLHNKAFLCYNVYTHDGSINESQMIFYTLPMILSEALTQTVCKGRENVKKSVTRYDKFQKNN